MSKPSICFVSPKAFPVLSGSKAIKIVGGAEVQQSIIAKALVGKGHEVSMVTCDFGQNDGVLIDRVTVYKAHKLHELGIKYIRFFHPRLTLVWKAMKKANADIYYQRGAGINTGLVAGFCKVHSRKFIFAGASNEDFKPGQQLYISKKSCFFYERCLKMADSVIVQNNEQKNLCQQNYGINSFLIPNCYEVQDSKEYSPEHILWVSTVRSAKRPEIFIELARRLREYRFMMVGGPGPGNHGIEYYKRIENMAEDIDNLKFVGFVPFSEVDKYFEKGCLLINTSQHEGFPNTFLQAWSREIPTISFFDIGARFNGRTIGQIVNSEEEMANAVSDLMSDWNKRSEVGCLCRAYFEKSYSTERVAAEFSRIITSLIKGN